MIISGSIHRTRRRLFVLHSYSLEKRQRKRGDRERKEYQDKAQQSSMVMFSSSSREPVSLIKSIRTIPR